MTTMCSVCKRILKQGPPGGEISHGYCPACAALLERDIGMDSFTDQEKIKLFDDFWWGGESAGKRISFKDLGDEFAVGIEEELEHTDDERVAAKIALDHMMEDPKYYTKLKKAGL